MAEFSVVFERLVLFSVQTFSKVSAKSLVDLFLRSKIPTRKWMFYLSALQRSTAMIFRDA
jgi:hypothetical protein